jgi:hypothetical protein
VAPRERKSVPWEIARRVFVGTMTFVAMDLIRRGVRMTLAPPEGASPLHERSLELTA